MFAEMIYKISTPRNKLHKYVDSNSHVPFEAFHTSSHLFWSRHQSVFLWIVLSQKGGFTGFQVLHIVGCSDPLLFSEHNSISPPLWRQWGTTSTVGWTQTSSLRQNSPRVPVARLFGGWGILGGSWCVYAGAERLTQCCYWWRVTLMHTWSGSCASGRALKGNRAAPLKSRCRGPFGAPLCKKPSGNADRTNTHTHPFDSQNHLSTNSPCNGNYAMIFSLYDFLGTQKAGYNSLQ